MWSDNSVCLDSFKTFDVLNTNQPSYICLQNILYAQIKLKQLQIEVCLKLHKKYTFLMKYFTFSIPFIVI